MKTYSFYPIIHHFRDCHLTKNASYLQSQYVSFDIFDTVLFRKKSPESMLIESSKRFSEILSEGHSPVDWFSIYEFRRKIIKSLKLLSRYKGKDPEYRIADMIDAICHRFLNSRYEACKVETSHRLLTAELDIEKSYLKPAPGIADYLSFILSNNKKIIFISDMYLSSNDIIELLKYFSLEQYFSYGFTSSEFLKTKRSGKIYKEVCQVLNIRPNDLVHIGDHAISDFRNPRKEGAHSFLFLNTRQKVVTQKRLFSSPFFLKYARMAYNLFRSEVHQQEVVKNFDIIYYDAAKFIIAPVFLAFAEHIFRIVKSQKIDRVYFVSRDGFNFYTYYKALCAEWKEEELAAKAEYSFFSRVATNLPHTSDIWKDGLKNDGWKLNLGGVEAFLKGFGISKKDIEYYCQKNKIVPNQKIAYSKTLKTLPKPIRALAEDEELGALINIEKKKQTHFLDSYLKQIGFFESARVLFVDIGWHGTLQNHLQTIFGSKEDYPKVHFQYFGYMGNESKESKKEKRDTLKTHQGFYFLSNESPFDRLSNTHSGGVTRLLENCCRPDHGTVMGYDQEFSNGEETIKPVFGPSLREMEGMTEKQLDCFNLFNEGLREGFKLWVPSDCSGEGEFLKRKTLSKKILYDLLTFPHFEDAGAFLTMPYEQNGGGNHIQSLRGLSLRVFNEGNRSVWIPANLTWSGLDILIPIYNEAWISLKRCSRLLSIVRGG